MKSLAEQFNNELGEEVRFFEASMAGLKHAGLRDNACHLNEEADYPTWFVCRVCGIETCMCYEGAGAPGECCKCWDRQNAE